MTDPPPSSLNDEASRIRMTESEWQDLRALVHHVAGIRLSEAKRVFLASRLRKRLRATQSRSFREYFQIVSRAGLDVSEHQELVNAVTTNKTDFFRESEHFEILHRWLSEPSQGLAKAKGRGLRIWCAAASTGEEPYSIAAVLQAWLTKREWGLAQVAASDIDTAVLASARRAVYDKGSVEVVEPLWRERMFVQGSEQYSHVYRIRRDLREHVHLFQQNLVLPDWEIKGRFDAIFCRNLLIYFDRATQEKVVRHLLTYLEPHGLFFVGAAESLNGLGLPIQTAGHSVYRLAESKSLELHGRSVTVAPVSAVRSWIPRGHARDSHGSRSSSGTEQPSPTQISLQPESQHSAEAFAQLNVDDVYIHRSGWLHCYLQNAVLIVVCDATNRRSLVAQLTIQSDPTVVENLRGTLSSWIKRAVHDGKELDLFAKVVGSFSSVEVSSTAQIPFVAAITELGIRVSAVRHYRSDVRIWLNGAQGRILVQSDDSDDEPLSVTGDPSGADLSPRTATARD